MKNSIDTIGSQTRSLLACSALPQPPPMAVLHIQNALNFQKYHVGLKEDQYISF